MNKKTKTTVAVAVIKTSQQYIYFTVPSIDWSKVLIAL
jgi:hypothetical protein